MAAPQVYLASASARRRELLAQIGIDYESLSIEVDEALLPAEAPEDYVIRLALAKARTGWAVLLEREPFPKQAFANRALALAPVLGADTSVVVEQTVFGKPRDREEGVAMLAALSGREHRVLSAVALVAGRREEIRLQQSWVRFRTLSRAQCQAYWDSGEPVDKAGGYAIQGRAAAFICELRGSYSGVMGLPLFETAELLQAFGISIF